MFLFQSCSHSIPHTTLLLPVLQSEREHSKAAMSGRSRKRPLDNIPRDSANLTPLGSRSTPGGLLPTPKPSSSETRRHSDVAVRPSRHSEEGRWHSNAGAAPPSKVSRLAGCELAGDEAELQFPEVHYLVSFPGQMSGVGMRLWGYVCI